MGRMVVQPGSAPQWIGSNRYGRRFRRGLNREVPQEIYDKKKEKIAQKEIEKILEEKFFESEQYTEQQKAKIKNTIKAQIKYYSEAIIKQAEDDLNIDFNEENPNYENLRELYYQELTNKAIQIAAKEFDISETFDIEEAIKKEKKVLEKVRAGEITKEEAKTILSKPTIFESRNNRYIRYINQAIHRNSDGGMER